MWKTWQAFAVYEGLTKTASSIFQKLVGVVMGTVAMGCVATIIIGAVQALVGCLGVVAQARKNSQDAGVLALLVPEPRAVLWAVAFGFFASIFGTVLGIYTFTLGADMGVRTLLISCSIVPGAIASRIIWGAKTDPLGLRQWAGITLFIVAMWAMLGFPSDIPADAWVWLTIGIGFSQAVNEILTRLASVKLNIWTNGFWVGVSSMFFATMALGLIALTGGGVTLEFSKAFVFGSLVIAGFVVLMISFKLLAYQGGGTVTLKKIIMPGTYLVTAIFAGAIVYGEPLTLGKFTGTILWLVSITLADKEVWPTLKAKFAPATA